MISISAALSCAEAKLRCHGTMLIMKNKNVPGRSVQARFRNILTMY